MSALAKSHASWFLIQYDIWKYLFFLIKLPVMCIIIFTRIREIYWQHRPRCAGYIQRRMEKQTQKTCRLPDILVDHLAKCCRISPPMVPDVICLAVFCNSLNLSHSLWPNPPLSFYTRIQFSIDICKSPYLSISLLLLSSTLFNHIKKWLFMPCSSASSLGYIVAMTNNRAISITRLGNDGYL